jgi:hypothetical protein
MKKNRLPMAPVFLCAVNSEFACPVQTKNCQLKLSDQYQKTNTNFSRFYVLYNFVQ